MRRRLRAMLGRIFGTRRGRRAFEALASDIGYDLVAHDWASPIPDLAALDDQTWGPGTVRGSEVPLSEFEALGAGDVLFMDTTHSQLVSRSDPERVASLIPSFVGGRSLPASFWIERTSSVPGR